FIMTVFILSLFTCKKKFIFNALIYLLVTSAVFYIPVTAYKFANKAFNDNFAVTDRGSHRLLGAAIRRTEPLTTEQFFVALSCVPGEGFCQSIFGKEKWSYWGVYAIDACGGNMVTELIKKGMKKEDAYRLAVRLAAEKALSNPGQYLLFCMMDGAKMLFWESTQIGYVCYPRVLERIFGCNLFKNGLRFSISALTFLALLYLAGFLWRRRKAIFALDRLDQGKAEIFMLFCALLILFFIGSYSLFATVPRFALPIASLYLIIVGFFLEKVISGK
ncbi:MAG: hypothetical protein Q8R48_08400, partial [Candidatus Omnitrophota bacterium]|nr:hypothetical protein [Candidatus Omnitrophota bacterium]